MRIREARKHLDPQHGSIVHLGTLLPEQRFYDIGIVYDCPLSHMYPKFSFEDTYARVQQAAQGYYIDPLIRIH